MLLAMDVLDRKFVVVPREIRQEVAEIGFRSDEDDCLPDSDVPEQRDLMLLDIEDALEFPLYRGTCRACGHESLSELESQECPMCLKPTMVWKAA